MYGEELRNTSDEDACVQCACGEKTAKHEADINNFQVSRAFGIPQKNIYISLVLVAHFLGTSLPPTPSWSRFDLFIYLQYFILLYF